jgi:hypothetical protein
VNPGGEAANIGSRGRVVGDWWNCPVAATSSETAFEEIGPAN